MKFSQLKILRSYPAHLPKFPRDENETTNLIQYTNIFRIKFSKKLLTFDPETM